MEFEFASPFTGTRLAALCVFLERQELSYDHDADFTVNAVEDGVILATGSLSGSVIKCVAVSPEVQGEGFAAGIISRLVTFAASCGRSHLFLFTKPRNRQLFGTLGFYPVAETTHILCMENRKNGVSSFVASLQKPLSCTKVGGIVVNCNPFTKGHLYLIEKASARCSLVYVFVVSEDKSFFSAADRFELAKKGCAHLQNVAVVPTSDYLISSATFPSYFIKDKADATKLNCELDLTIFARCFAQPLNITCRFAGTEPTDAVTAAYNRQMAEILPRFGIEFVEIARRETGGYAVSASLVRRLFVARDFAAIRLLVPQTTFDFLRSLEMKGSHE